MPSVLKISIIANQHEFNPLEQVLSAVDAMLVDERPLGTKST